MAEKMIKQIIEALLFVGQKPLTMDDLRQALDGLNEDKIKEAIYELKEDYLKHERSFGIAELAGGYQIVTNPEFAPWIGKLFRREETKLSAPSLETLAIIAYKQPLTRSEIESIRGVNVEGVLKTLLDKNLIKVRGRKNAPGRPIAYGTTEEFLKRFGLKGLESLPRLRDFSEHDLEFDKEGEKLLEVEPLKEVDENASGQESAQNRPD
ncbi:MAG: SMC-Scp complex subunit ScpB [Candidatus Omnitrophica bacterium]|nr:SMC-Scp complex subunit ScpB [Candidatus Omnitrophota bacterium]